MPDNSMRSERGGAGSFEQDDWLVIDPAVPPAMGKIVHAVDPSTHEHVIRRYVPLHTSDARAPGYVLRPANANPA